MGFLQDTSDAMDNASWTMNENLFRESDYVDNFYTRKIGVYNKNYDFMVNHIMRNIGNAEHTYDGYGTPIGELANPFYNTVTRVPWFLNDDYKKSTSNYIDYVRATYGASIRVENINETNLFHIIDSAVRVGAIDGLDAINALQNNYDFIPNPNIKGKDTRLGVIGGYYNQKTLSNAKVSNDERLTYNFGITEKARGAFGLTTKNIKGQQGNRSFDKEISKKSGRFESTNTLKSAFSPLLSIDSPVETSNYGNIKDIGSYEGFYNFLTNRTKSYYADNVFFNRERNSKNKKFYYPSFPGVSENRVYNGENINIDKLTARYIVKTKNANITDLLNGGVYVYAENEYGSSPDITFTSYNPGVKFGRYTSYGEGLTANDLLKKTNESFKNGNYKTIIARFHTDASEADSTDTTQTAVSAKYGLSHGRNLLKVKPDDSEGYNNPYCRVWTYHHQYHRLADAIRPLNYSPDELYSKYNFSAFTANHSSAGFENGRERLEKYGTLNKNNGLVNITPIDNGDENKKVDVRNCMFSIENLAWKDVFSTDASSRESFQSGGLSPEQKGPFGGRIMWFPPYDLKFNEDVNVNWNETNFIGRGEGIYTYTNTTRTGSLSFKILVDHPSIIDYWENRGRSTSNSVDDIDDPEQQILRFFAGCDMLTGSPGPVVEDEAAVSDNPIPSPDSQELKFFVFFPNYYSGKDDSPEWAMKYITNGLGAGKEKAWHMKANGDCYRDDEITDYDIPYANAQNRYGGYEMRPGMPISIVREQDEANIKARGGLIEEVQVGAYGNGTKCNEHKTSLFVQMGDDTTQWWQRKWYYRVDDAYVNRLLLKENYVDRTSYCLNSNAGLAKVAEHFSIENNNALFSLADVYVAFDKNSSIENGANYVLKGLYNKEKVDNLKSWISQYGIKKVTCAGRASAPGRNEENYVLQMNRAKTVKNWLCAFCGFDSELVEATRGGAGGEGAGINNGDDSTIVNKLWRCVEVTIELQKSVSKTVQSSLSESLTSTDPNQTIDETTSAADLHQTNNLGTTDSIISGYENSGVRRTFTFTDLSANRYVEQKSYKDTLAESRLFNPTENINGLGLNIRNPIRIGIDIDKQWYGANQNRGKSDYNYTQYGMHDGAAQTESAGLNNTLQDKTDVDVSNSENVSSTRDDNATIHSEDVRYDNEAKFFTLLEKEEPFLHHKISDKIKYFDPAFHSISPEGFNARLTFLQQCTRQGPTIGSSDNYTENNTANNLAFGRPPVCILRIGDFYYTKIIIDGLTINFDPLMWDLNTEGIGVMPMIADVNLRFKFIGGSSLAGHITRLQNALSFNYYANTEVYDNRSELAEYDENGNIVKFKPNPIK